MTDIKSKKLDALSKKIEQLKAQKTAEEARLKAKQRKDDTRRKILVGAYYLDKAERKNKMDELINTIDPYLKRKKDRKLFGLPDSSNIDDGNANSE